MREYFFKIKNQTKMKSNKKSHAQPAVAVKLTKTQLAQTKGGLRGGSNGGFW
jgi:hypothetical protein